jgi:hypothetical protein
MSDAVPLRWFRFAVPAPASGQAPPAPEPPDTSPAAGSAAASQVVFASDLGLPSPRRCVSRRSFRVHVLAPRGQRLRSAQVYVNGRRVRVLTGRRALAAPVDLRGLRAGVVKVRLVVRTTSGRTYTRTRTYHTCVPQRPA